MASDVIIEKNTEMVVYTMWYYSWNDEASIWVWGWLLYGPSKWCHIRPLQDYYMH